MSITEQTDFRVGASLKRAQHAYRSRIDASLRGLHLTAPQYAVLVAVAADSGLSNADLARIAFVTPQSMQGLLANMARNGHLARKPDPQNRRILRAELTDDGRLTLRQASEIVSEIEQRMVRAIGPQNITSLIEMLTCCAEAL